MDNRLNLYERQIWRWQQVYLINNCSLGTLDGALIYAAHASIIVKQSMIKSEILRPRNTKHRDKSGQPIRLSVRSEKEAVSSCSRRFALIWHDLHKSQDCRVWIDRWSSVYWLGLMPTVLLGCMTWTTSYDVVLFHSYAACHGSGTRSIG